MDWQTKMNHALNYIEENLTGEIKLATAAKFVGCSVWEFQRLFSFVTHTSLGEYIRSRKLALAANDIQISEEKIIDICMKYGYDSPAAFSRAFGRQYGVSPSSARSAIHCHSRTSLAKVIRSMISARNYFLSAFVYEPPHFSFTKVVPP